MPEYIERETLRDEIFYDPDHDSDTIFAGKRANDFCSYGERKKGI